MQISDKNYFHKYAIDPSMEFDFEELYGIDLLYDFTSDDKTDQLDDRNFFNV